MLGDATGRDGQGTQSHFKQLVGESWRDAPCLTLHQRAKHHVLWTVSTHSHLDPVPITCLQKVRGHRRWMSCWRRRANSRKPPRSPQCQAATSVALGGALNHFQSTSYCPKLKQQLLAVDGEPTAIRTPHTHKKAERSVLHAENKGTSGTSSAVPYERRRGRQWTDTSA